MTIEGRQVRLSILKALQERGRAAGADYIQRKLLANGIELKPRTIRFYLLQLDQEGFTRFVSRRRGREITSRGLEELTHTDIMERVGFVAAKINALSYRMNLDLDAGTGTLIANVATVRASYLARAIDDMRPVFTRGLAMGTRLAVAHEGQTLAGLTVPPGMIAIGTVCSVTTNGIFLRSGIPVTSRFGALLEIKDERPVRCLELIDYTGTTLDPLEVFMQAGMTRVRECARSGRGIIGASFREAPSESRMWGSPTRRSHSPREGSEYFLCPSRRDARVVEASAARRCQQHKRLDVNSLR